MVLKGRIKNIFFDLDNTLWDFTKNSVLTLQELFDDYVKGLDKAGLGWKTFFDIYTNHNDRLWEDYRKGRVDKETLRFLRFKSTLEDMGIDKAELACTIENEYVTRTSYKPHLVDNAIEILDYLYGKYRLGIITNGFVEAQEIKLKNCNLERYFEFIIVSERARVSKPDPAIFDYALTTYSLNRDETVYVGDDYNVDAVCAVNSGIPAIWLNRNNEAVKDLNGCIEVKDLVELKSIF